MRYLHLVGLAVVIGLAVQVPAFARGGHGGHGQAVTDRTDTAGTGITRMHMAHIPITRPRGAPITGRGEVGPSLITAASTIDTLPGITPPGLITTRIIGTTGVPTVVGDITTAGVTTMVGVGAEAGGIGTEVA